MIPTVTHPWLAAARRWLAFGAGAGIEIGPADLNVIAVRVRPSGARITGALSIHGYRSQPAAQWGATYSNFLAKLGASHLAAVVVLPRNEVVVRQVALPGVAAKDTQAALSFQIDALHPYGDDEAAWSWSRIAGTGQALVGITRRERLEQYQTLFAEAGVKVAAFLFSAAGFHGASRLYGAPPGEGFLALDEWEGAKEVYGESRSRGVFSAILDVPAERARTLALSELRLDPETPALPLAEILPRPLEAPEGLDLSRVAVPYSAALAGACPRLALPLNLLPPEQRQSSSRAIFIPTLGLAGLILMLAAALGISGTIESRQYKDALQSQIRAAEIQASKARALDRKIAETRERARRLDAFRSRSKDDMDTLAELTRILAPPTWLRGIDLTRAQADISGDAEQAAALLKLLDSSPKFRNSEFAMPLQRLGSMETFRIRAARKDANP